MTEDYVSLEKFNGLEKRVMILEDITKDNKDLLIKIDKKVDVISEKIINSDKIEELKIEPLKSRVEKLEKHQNYLWEIIIGAVVMAVLGLVIGGI